MSARDWPSVEDRDAVEALADLLRRENYSAEGINEVFGADGGFVRDPGNIPLYLRRLDASARSTLLKLFLLDVQVPSVEAERALAPLSLERAVDAGVLRLEADHAAGTVNIVPSEELLLASDPYEGEGAPRTDHVLGVSISSRVLAAITVRRQVGCALDIGTGGGTHALAAAAHAERVVGADVNPRALRFAEFNAALNRISNVDFREGSVFDPVEGERFDLIVSNPPYVVSPDADYVYRDSGLPGDSFSEGLIRRAPEFLTEGGLAHVLVEWVHGADEPWGAPPRRWVEGSGCDALIIHYMSSDTLAYAGAWNAELRRDPIAYGSAIDRWLDYDRRLGIERIGWGAIVLRRRKGPNWIRTISPNVERMGPASHQVERLIAAQDYLTSLTPERGLLEGVFSLADDHRFDQTFTISGGEGVLERSVLRLEGGLRLGTELDPRTVRAVTELDGRRPLGEILAAVAPEAPGSPTPEEFMLQTLPDLAGLIEIGLVVPVE